MTTQTFYENVATSRKRYEFISRYFDTHPQKVSTRELVELDAKLLKLWGSDRTDGFYQMERDNVFKASTLEGIRDNFLKAIAARKTANRQRGRRIAREIARQRDLLQARDWAELMSQPLDCGDVVSEDFRSVQDW